MSDSERPNRPGGDLELALLGALWDRGDASARDLHEVVGGPRGIVYTTVAKVLDRLVEKHLVERELSGRAYVYRAVVERGQIQRLLAEDFVARMKGGAPRPAMAALVDALEDVDPKCLDELAELIESRRGGRHGA